jgi:hypothetical protein
MDTFWWHLKLSALGNLHCLNWTITVGGWGVLNLLNNVISLKNLAKNDMSTIEPTTFGKLALFYLRC